MSVAFARKATIRRAALGTLGVALSALTACSLIVDTSGLSDGAARDGASPDVVASDGGEGSSGGDAGADSSDGAIGGGDASAEGGPAAGPIAFDPGSTWPVSTPSTAAAPTTPAFRTSAECTDLVVLANTGVNGGSTATATISSDTGMTFAEVVDDAGYNADSVYIWHATSSCAARSGTITVTWSVTDGSSNAWANVAVFAFIHSKGIGATAHAHTDGSTSTNTISITPGASGSWLFASLSGNGGNDATSVGTPGAYVQQWSSEAAIQSYGPSRTPSATTLGKAVTFSLPTPDNIWANAAAEVLSQ